jgi:hypothetical protein
MLTCSLSLSLYVYIYIIYIHYKIYIYICIVMCCSIPIWDEHGVYLYSIYMFSATILQ